MKRLSFSPGWKHTLDVPHVCHQAKVGKVALLTSRAPGEPEDTRFVFAIFDIASVRISKEGDWAGTEYFDGTEERAIVFEDDARPRFWDFHTNPRKPEVIAWGAGLFRYVTDKSVRRLLTSVVDSSRYSKEQQRRAQALLACY